MSESIPYDPCNAQHVVVELNHKLLEAWLDTPLEVESRTSLLEFRTDGFYDCIMFANYCLWDSEDRGPELLNADTDAEVYETVEACVRRRFDAYIDNLRLARLSP